MSTATVNPLHTESGIRAVLANPMGTTNNHPNKYIIWKMLHAMNARQTSDEQTSQFTKHVNGVGFNKFDASFLTDVASKTQQFKDFTDGRATAVAKALQKYIGQLMDIANVTPDKQENTVPSEQNVPEVTASPKPRKEKKVHIIKRRKVDTIKRKYQVDEKPELIKETDGGYLNIEFPEESIAKYEEALKAIKECQLFHRVPAKNQPIQVEGQPEVPTKWMQIWRVRSTEDTIREVAAFGKKFRFDFAGDILIRAQASSDESKELTKMSYAKSAPTQKLPPLPKGKECHKCNKWHEGTAIRACKNCKHKFCSKCKGLQPLKFQPAGMAYALRAKKTFIADEMGLGKTIQALLVIAYVMKVMKQPGQWLIIVPKNVKINWYREAKKWLGSKTEIGICDNSHLTPLVTNKKALTAAEKKSALRRSKKWLLAQKVVIVNYDRVLKYEDHLAQINWMGLVLDESHYCKSNSMRTRSIKSLLDTVKDRQEPEYVLCLSGTPVLNNPKELVRQLQILNRMTDFGGPIFFLNRYCNVANVDASKLPPIPKMNEDGIVVGSANTDQEIRDMMIRKAFENQVELNHHLRGNCYVRREKVDVLTDMPEKSRSTILLDINNRKVYEKVEQDVIGYLMDQAEKDQKFLSKIAHLSKEDHIRAIKEHRNDIGYRSARAEAIVRLEKLKQVAAIGKLDEVKEWLENVAIENNEKVVVFGNHINIQDEMETFFPKITVRSSGGSDEKRQEKVDEFNNEAAKKLFIASLKRDGVGINLQKASNVAFVELGWTPAIHDQAEDRCHRYGQKSAVNCYYLIAKNTVEEKIARLIERKRNIVDATSYGDPLAKSQAVGSILGDLVSELTGKKTTFTNDEND